MAGPRAGISTREEERQSQRATARMRLVRAWLPLAEDKVAVKDRAMAKEIVLAKNRNKEKGKRGSGRGPPHQERRAQIAKAWTHQTRLVPAAESQLFPGRVVAPDGPKLLPPVRKAQWVCGEFRRCDSRNAHAQDACRR